MVTSTIEKPKVVSRQEWLAARTQLLAKEKKLTREREALAAERRQLPWVNVEDNYVFDSPEGKKTLAELFDGKRQLIVYHFMFSPDWEEGCPSCSFVMDHTDGTLVHLAQRDVSFVAVSRAPIAKLETFRKRMGGSFVGCHRMRMTSTATIVCPSRKMSKRRTMSTTSPRAVTQAKKPLDSPSSTKTGLTFSTPIRHLHAVWKRS